MNKAILPRDPVAALYRFWEQAAQPAEPDLLLSPDESPVRWLTNTQIGCLRVLVPDSGLQEPARLSLVGEAALRVGVWKLGGRLEEATGWDLARELQGFYWTRSRGAVRPLRGLDLMRRIDETSAQHGVRIAFDKGGQHRLGELCRGLLLPTEARQRGGLLRA